MTTAHYLALLVVVGSASATAEPIPEKLQAKTHYVQSHNLVAAAKTFRVVLSKSDQGHNRTIFIQAEDSSDARQSAKDQNPGWHVEEVSESK